MYESPLLFCIFGGIWVSSIIHYLMRMLPYVLLVLPFYVSVRYSYLRYTKKHISLSYEICLGSFVLYLVGVASQTIIPQKEIGFGNSGINLIPFKTISEFLFLGHHFEQAIINLLGNIFLFTPFGLFIYFLFPKHLTFKLLLCYGLMITLFIEVTQLGIGRSVGIDDVILNTIGVLIGYVLAKFYEHLI